MAAPVKLNKVGIRNNGKSTIEVVDGGKAWKVIDASGKTAKINIDRPMPDGTRLTSPENAHFLDAMQSSLSAIWGGEDDEHRLTRVASLRTVVTNQYGWIYWLVDRGYRRFESVQTWDIEAYIHACAQIPEGALNARKKIRTALKRLQSKGMDIATMGFSDILDESNLPFNRWLNSVVEEVRGEVLHRTKRKGGRKKKNASESSLINKGFAIKLLHRQCRPDQSRLTFDPEDYVTDALSTVEPGTPTGTRLIPMEAAMRLMDQAARWVISVAPVLLDFRDLLIDLSKLEGTLGEAEFTRRRHALLDMVNADLQGLLPGPLTFDYRNPNGRLGVRSVFTRMLPAASFTCVGTLSGRRDIEIRSLRHGACSGTEESGYWLETYIGKNIQSEQRTPCSRLIVDAVAVLEEYAQLGTEGCDRSDLLFVMPMYGNPEKSALFNSSAALQDFADYVGASSLGVPTGGRWLIARHQLRKLFAVVYVWRYDAGDLDALSYHLRHQNLQVTIRYCGSRDLYDEIERQIGELTRRKITNMVNKTVGSAGIYAKKLKKLVERFLPAIEFSTEDETKRKVERLMKAKGIALRATPWGFCGCSDAPSHLRRAACRRDTPQPPNLEYDGRPDTTASNEGKCSGCIFFMSDSTRIPHWESACEKVRAELYGEHTVRLRKVRLRKNLNTLESFTSALTRAAV
ncbi:Uncharacterised protein [Burkholderia pseudomallei]|uniref:hypothetical protein n=1 Tax=Burkholderia pseudomallei TaxID=28450 RepID=UPI00025C26EB|nr:hypothetical protein [Burkholderia pseudomallei]ARL49477.1 hypothetical protein BOC51_05270 [Burkholderia pseudomallei]EIF70905.1 hypothetical protein BP354E_4939 [Burkholderia pseudomallei 354e]EIF73288.1 hypothetical protein BP354A_5774 [Burkholderia pseudomallei 354a]MBF3557401.1 hypothetical protein [Burkholderia pseudomallei]MDY7816329.1 hypothetical protein [Burkholderia pseudomallei]